MDILTILTFDMERLEESRPGFTKNWRNESTPRHSYFSCTHEVEELKRAQEMRIDELSRQELREGKATFHELTSQIQELQERERERERE